MKLQEGDWIEWSGGERPVYCNTLVDVGLRDGRIVCNFLASCYTWEYHDIPSDIIKYKVLGTQQLPEDAQAEDEEFLRIEKQARYTREDGSDTIDKWVKEYTPERFRHVMWAQVDKYHDRLGKKDPIAQEVRKMADYMNRWALVEEGRSNE